MQETTFNSAYQADGSIRYPNSHVWLNTLYAEASQKKFDHQDFYHLIINQISFSDLETKIHYTFVDKKNLSHSLTQSTFCYEMKWDNHLSNERLEFLGDSLVNFIVGKNLFYRYGKQNEGDLSKLRGALVNEERLSDLAREIRLGDYLFLGKGEHKTKGWEKDSILADAFEALIAAIYIDSAESMDGVQSVLKHVINNFEKTSGLDFYALEQVNTFDPKTKLQEMMMEMYGAFPIYKSTELSNQEGFTVTVFLRDRLIAEMVGVSKKKTEKLLAKKIIDEKLYAIKL